MKLNKLNRKSDHERYSFRNTFEAPVCTYTVRNMVHLFANSIVNAIGFCWFKVQFRGAKKIVDGATGRQSFPLFLSHRVFW